ncbi:MAG: hypothetical protein A3D33_18185 [Candidatus Rokubacteria bacterium RIFCSPHIGHO2_02_FULL_73_26]|nr:MAG: hypothetical protein A3D33_18185 [Candidatus Rokubacteria bacterium RIFCSPHIGHO2_02_FULL_73_26]
MELPVKTAEELIDPALEVRWAARRSAQHGEALQWILRAFVARGGPIRVEEIPGAIRDAVAALDGDDLIRVHDGCVDLAYPFSAAPTPFVVRLADGSERYACCAIDALGVAPMLGEPVRIGSACHHCGVPLELPVAPDGPGPEAAGLMVWVGPRTEGARRMATSL